MLNGVGSAIEPLSLTGVTAPCAIPVPFGMPAMRRIALRNPSMSGASRGIWPESKSRGRGTGPEVANERNQSRKLPLRRQPTTSWFNMPPPWRNAVEKYGRRKLSGLLRSAQWIPTTISRR